MKTFVVSVEKRMYAAGKIKVRAEKQPPGTMHGVRHGLLRLVERHNHNG